MEIQNNALYPERLMRPDHHVLRRLLVSGQPETLAKFEQTLNNDSQLLTLLKPANGASIAHLTAPPVLGWDGHIWKEVALTLPGSANPASLPLTDHFNQHRQESRFATRRYTLNTNQPILQVAQSLYETLQKHSDSSFNKLNVFVEQLARFSLNGGGGGAPGGSPDLREFARAAATATAHDFQNQDCFRRIGANGSGVGQNRGTGVSVVILDTAPTHHAHLDPDLVDYFIDMAGPDDEYAPLPVLPLDPPQPCLNLGDTKSEMPPPPGERNLQNVKLEHYHGLMTASLVKQLAPQAKVVLIKVLNNQGEVSGSRLASALDYVGYLHQHGVLVGNTPLIANKLVINLSLGIQRFVTEEVEACYLLAACEELCKAGAVMVCAAGNDSYLGRPKNPEEPAAYGYFSDTPTTHAQVIAVAATSHEANSYAFFSNRGNLAAPGYELLLDTGQNSAHHDTTRYIYWSGTSFATPQVSAACALLLNAGVAPGQVKQKLWETATMPARWDGVPEINVGKARLSF